MKEATKQCLVSIMKCYLAGKMSGCQNFGGDLFVAGARLLRSQGYEVFSPFEADIARGGEPWGKSGNEPIEEFGFTRRDALGVDVAWICSQATHIALLPGWETSSGANAEYFLGRALGLSFLYLTEQDLKPFIKAQARNGKARKAAIAACA